MPKTSIIPIGGYPDVIKFSHRMLSVLPAHIKIRPLLDQDAKDGIQNPVGNDTLFISAIAAMSGKINYFSITPEQGIISWVFKQATISSKTLQNFDSLFGTSVNSHFTSEYIEGGVEYNASQTTNKAGRDKSKAILDSLVEKFSQQSPSVNKDTIQEKIIECYAKNGIPEGEIKGLFGKLFR
jgi:hypothetical protein